MYLGDFTPGKTIRHMWNANAVAGESITRATNGTISVYKDGGTTQSTTGVTDTEDFDSLTGVNLVAIDTSADGTFYSAGSDFMIVLSAATIDGKTINAVLAQFSLANRSALRPTTADRTLDVSAGGEAGVDLANVGSPTTTLNLSGTTIKTATDVETDTADIQSRLPAALVSGRIDASVGAMAANTLTATAIANDAITAAKIATGAIDADAIADNAIDAGAIAADAITAAKIADGAIDAATFAAGAINAAAVASDAFGAAELAADATVEIAAAVWDRVLSGATHNIAASAGRRLRELSGSIIAANTAQGGTANTITLASGESSTDGIYDPAIVRLVGGTGAGQARLIIHYTGSTRVAVVDRDWRVTPDNTTLYELIAAPNLMSTNEGLAQGGGSTSITLNASASAVDDTYRGQLVVIRTGTGQDQARIITDYNGTTKVATVGEAWATNPDSASGYMIWPVGRSLVASMLAGVIDAAAIAPDALGDSELSSAAVAEIQSGLSTLDAAGVRAAVGLASANLDTQLDALPTAGENADAVWDEARSGHTTNGTFGQGVASVQGNVTGSVGSVTGAVGSVTGNVGGNVTGSVGSLATQAKADVNAEVVDVLETDTHAELSALPGDTPTFLQMWQLMFQAVKHKLTTTATVQSLYKANSTDVLAERNVSDDGTTNSRDKMTAP